MSFRNRCALGTLLVFAAIAVAYAENTSPENRLKLWEIIHDQCLTGQTNDRDPAPCVHVDLSHGKDKGYAVLPDRNGVAQFLLIPTRQITGIESPDLLASNLPPYWVEAWDARRYVTTKLHKQLPDDAIGLAINAQPSRSQDQMHIHLDCLSPETRHALQQHAGEISPHWAPLSFPLAGQSFRARKITAAELHRLNPFAALASELNIAPADMGKETLAMTGAPGDAAHFILIEGRADPVSNNKGHSEDLLDASCAIADGG